MNTTSTEHYLAEFSKRKLEFIQNEAPWLSDLREQAMTDFALKGFPQRGDESWKYTRTTAIEKHPFHCANASHSISRSQIENYFLTDTDHYRLVFINGFFSAEFSDLTEDFPQGMTLTHLASAWSSQNIQEYLSQCIQKKPLMTTLNTAFMSDGLYLHLAPQTVVKKPIHVLYICEGDNTTRNLIILGSNSHVTMIEQHLSKTENRNFTNHISEIYLEEDSTLEHIKIQDENLKTFHLSGIHCSQKKGSELKSHVFSFGGELARTEIHVELAGEQARCILNGLYQVNANQHMDHHTHIAHTKPLCTSQERYKGVLNEAGHGVFNGKITVSKNAAHTDARLSNHNLLLSRGAEIDTKPELEIYADEVKCSHGATIGQLDQNALFYLQSRGISESNAKQLLVYAFLQEMIDNINQPQIREYCQMRLR